MSDIESRIARTLVRACLPDVGAQHFPGRPSNDVHRRVVIHQLLPPAPIDDTFDRATDQRCVGQVEDDVALDSGVEYVC